MLVRRSILLVFSALSVFITSGLLLRNAGITAREREAGGQKQQMLNGTVASVPEEKTKLPYLIPNTTLVAELVAVYEGPFVEDGSDTEVANVSALMLRNVGTDGILFAGVEIRGSGGRMFFEAGMIPPGQAVLVAEKYKCPYRQAQFCSCTGWQITESENWWPKDAPMIAQTGMDRIELTNATENDVGNITVYYKGYEPSAGVYLGGRTYSVSVRRLTAGQALEVILPHYAKGYSRIVRITTG